MLRTETSNRSPSVGSINPNPYTTTTTTQGPRSSRSPRSAVNYGASVATSMRFKSMSSVLPVSTLPNDIRCCAFADVGNFLELTQGMVSKRSRSVGGERSSSNLNSPHFGTEAGETHMVSDIPNFLLGTDQCPLALITGGKNGEVDIRNAVSGIIEPPASWGSSVSIGGPLEPDIGKKHGANVTSVTYTPKGHIWCGYAEGHIRVYSLNEPLNHQVNYLSEHQSYRSTSPMGSSHASNSGGGVDIGYHPSPPTINDDITRHGSYLLFEAHRHSGPITAIVHSLLPAGAKSSIPPCVFTCGVDWQILKWGMEYPFHLGGCVGTHSLAVRCLCVTPKLLVSGGDDHHIKCWPFHALEKRQTLSGHGSAVVCLLYHRGMLWSGSEDGNIRVWSLEGDRQCTQVLVGHQSHVTTLFPIDDLMYSADKEGVILVWELQNYEVLHCYRSKHLLAPASSSLSETRKRSPAKRQGSIGSGGSMDRLGGLSKMTRSSSVASKSSIKMKGVTMGQKPGTSKTSALLTAGSQQPSFLHEVKFAANVKGLMVWMLTTSGAKLALLPHRPIEEELEKRFGPFPGPQEGTQQAEEGLHASISPLELEELKRSLEQFSQREERQYERLQDLQQERDEFADYVNSCFEGTLGHYYELYHDHYSRAMKIYHQAVATLKMDERHKEELLQRKILILEQTISEKDEKLAAKSNLFQANNAKQAQIVASKTEEAHRLQLDLAKATNEVKQLQFELRMAKDSTKLADETMKKHEAKVSKEKDVDVLRTKNELKVAQDALEKLREEADRQVAIAKRQTEKYNKLLSNKGEVETQQLIKEIETLNEEKVTQDKKYMAQQKQMLLLREELDDFRIEKDANIAGRSGDERVKKIMALRQQKQNAFLEDLFDDETITSMVRWNTKYVEDKEGGMSDPSLINEAGLATNTTATTTTSSAQAKSKSEKSGAKTKKGGEKKKKEEDKEKTKLEKILQEDEGHVDVDDDDEGDFINSDGDQEEEDLLLHSEEAKAKREFFISFPRDACIALMGIYYEQRSKMKSLTKELKKNKKELALLESSAEELASRSGSPEGGGFLSAGGVSGLQRAVLKKERVIQSLKEEIEDKNKIIADLNKKSEVEKLKVTQLQAAVGLMKEKITKGMSSTGSVGPNATGGISGEQEDMATQLQQFQKDSENVVEMIHLEHQAAIQQLHAELQEAVREREMAQKQNSNLREKIDNLSEEASEAIYFKQKAQEFESYKAEKGQLIGELKKVLKGVANGKQDVHQLDEEKMVQMLQSLSLHLDEGGSYGSSTNYLAADEGHHKPGGKDVASSSDKEKRQQDGSSPGLQRNTEQEKLYHVIETLGSDGQQILSADEHQRVRELLGGLSGVSAQKKGGHALHQHLPVLTAGDGSHSIDDQSMTNFIAYLDQVKNKLLILEAAAVRSENPQLRDGILVEIQRLHQQLLKKLSTDQGKALLAAMTPLAERKAPLEVGDLSPQSELLHILSMHQQQEGSAKKQQSPSPFSDPSPSPTAQHRQVRYIGNSTTRQKRQQQSQQNTGSHKQYYTNYESPRFIEAPQSYQQPGTSGKTPKSPSPSQVKYQDNVTMTRRVLYKPEWNADTIHCEQNEPHSILRPFPGSGQEEFHKAGIDNQQQYRSHSQGEPTVINYYRQQGSNKKFEQEKVGDHHRNVSPAAQDNFNVEVEKLQRQQLSAAEFRMSSRSPPRRK